MRVYRYSENNTPLSLEEEVAPLLLEILFTMRKHTRTESIASRRVLD